MLAEVLQNQNGRRPSDPTEEPVGPEPCLSFCLSLAGAIYQVLVLKGLTGARACSQMQTLLFALTVCRNNSPPVACQVQAFGNLETGSVEAHVPDHGIAIDRKAGMYHFSTTSQVITSPKVGAGASPMSPLCLFFSSQAVWWVALWYNPLRQGLADILCNSGAPMRAGHCLVEQIANHAGLLACTNLSLKLAHI